MPTIRRRYTVYIYSYTVYIYIAIYIVIYTAVCKKLFSFEKTFLGAKKSLTCSHRKIFTPIILKISHVYPNYSGWKEIF